MARKEIDNEKPIIVYDDGVNGRTAFKSKFKSRFGKSDRQSLFLRLEREERKNRKNINCF